MIQENREMAGNQNQKAHSRPSGPGLCFVRSFPFSQIVTLLITWGPLCLPLLAEVHRAGNAVFVSVSHSGVIRVYVVTASYRLHEHGLAILPRCGFFGELCDSGLSLHEAFADSVLPTQN